MSKSKNTKFVGFEDEVIRICLEDLSQKYGITVDEMSDIILKRVNYKKLTKEDIEARNYTFVCANYENMFWGKTFLVGTPYAKPTERYIEEKGWDKPISFSFYPRNYIVKARKLFKYDNYI